MLSKLCLLLAGILGGSAVLLGALEAHVLKLQLETSPVGAYETERRLDNGETAVRYQMIHALALLGTGLLALNRRHFLLAPAAGALVLGTLLFCGALHVHAYTGNPAVLKPAPAGGMLLIMGWLALGCAGALAKPIGAPSTAAPAGPATTPDK